MIQYDLRSDCILIQVRNVPVTCSKIPLISLDYEPPRCIIDPSLSFVNIYFWQSETLSVLICLLCRTTSFKTIEASLRVDALASAGFKISRSKLVDMIRLAMSSTYRFKSVQIFPNC